MGVRTWVGAKWRATSTGDHIAILAAIVALFVPALFAGLKLSIAERYVSVAGGPAILPHYVDGRITEPVREYFKLRDEATYGPLDGEKATLRKALGWLDDDARTQLRKRLQEQVKYETGQDPEQPDLLAELLGNRMVWTNAASGPGEPLELKVRHPDAEGVTSLDFKLKQAEVVPADGRRIVLRRAQSGCRVLEGPHVVVPGDGRWLIHKLPDDRRCTGEEYRSALRESWAWTPPAVDRPIGIGLRDDTTFPPWARGNLQRIEPIDWSPKSNSDGSAGLAVDREKAGKVTAWRSPVADAVGSEVRYTFPAKVGLARILIHNGADGRSYSDRFRRNGRIAIATLVTDTGEFRMVLPDRPEFYELRCDFGPTTQATLTVNSIYPARSAAAKERPEASIGKLLRPLTAREKTRSNVAASTIEFWGTKTAAPATRSPAVLAAPRPKYTRGHSYRAVCPQLSAQRVGQLRADDGTQVELALTHRQWQAVLGEVGEEEQTADADAPAQQAVVPAEGAPSRGRPGLASEAGGEP